MSCFLKKKFYQTNPITWNENGNWIVKKIKFFIAEMVLWEYINYYLWLPSSFLWAYSLLPENLDLAGTDIYSALNFEKYWIYCCSCPQSIQLVIKEKIYFDRARTNSKIGSFFYNLHKRESGVARTTLKIGTFL